MITTPDGGETSLFGTSVLWFAFDGRVLEHRDHWVMQDRA